jgi:lipoprotein-releasing system permease protein
MYLRFAWRYFRAKKSANAINIIAWLTTFVIAVVTFCQVVVLSVFNGFEGLVKSLYSSFYTDLRISPSAGKTFTLTQADIQKIKSLPAVEGIAMTAEDKALLQNGESQTVITLKGVDSNYQHVSGVAEKTSRGVFNTGSLDTPGIVVGYGVQNAADISISDALPPQDITVILPKKNSGADAADAMSEGVASANGVFAIQQEIDAQYAITNIDFVKQQMGYAADEYSSMEIKLKPKQNDLELQKLIQQQLGNKFTVKTRYQQNAGLYNTMNLEKWAIYGVFTLILIIAAFTMVSALTILVLEKKKDISILRSMGTTKAGIQKIFLSEGLLLGGIGAGAGIIMAFIVCLLQLKFHFIKLQGGSFLIDYFPVKMIAGDFLMVAGSAMLISFLASWFPSYKAAGEKIALK